MPRPQPPRVCHPERKHYSKGMCRACYMARFYPPKARNKNQDDRYYRRKYGITKKQADAYRSKFPNCMICGKTGGGRYKALHIDHDHKTGAIRGLLCWQCNTFVGFIENRFHLLQRTFNYLKMPTEVAADERY